MEHYDQRQLPLLGYQNRIIPVLLDQLQLEVARVASSKTFNDEWMADPGFLTWCAGCDGICFRHPWQPDGLPAILAGVTAEIATSGRYERGHHLYSSPGKRVAHVALATVTGPSLAMADAIATALAVGGDEVLRLITDLDGY